MAFVNPTTPNVADFTTFLQTSVGIPTSALPTNSPWITYAFNQAVALTLQIAQVTAIEYVLAVYNCGTHILIKITPDEQALVTASITTGTLDVTDVASGTIAVGMQILNIATPVPTITAFGTGTGGTGTYTISQDLTVSSTSMTLQGTYFQTQRGKDGFDLVGVPNAFLSASSDESTSQTMAVSDALQTLSLTDLDFMRTPWGREWIEYGQDYGPVWGLT